MITSWSHGQNGHFGKAPVPGLSLISGGRALMRSLPKGSLGAGLNACNIYKNGLSAARGVLCPTICILASDDKMVPLRKGKEVGTLIPDSSTHIINECGHMIMLEKSDECLEALKSHFKNIKF